MSERAAFINAILDNPADDAVRLVFADWLEEHGEPERAEFIRCQIETARLSDAGENSKPFTRATALEVAHRHVWRAALGVGKNEGQYERGFLTNLWLSAGSFVATASKLLAVEPVGIDLRLECAFDGDVEVISKQWVEEFAKSPLLRAVTTINSRNGGFGAERFARLMSSPHLVNLKAIHLFEDIVEPGGVKAIADSPSAFTLEDLDLNSALQFEDMIGESDDTRAAVEIIASSARFASLKHLGLMFNELSDESIQLLLSSKTLPRDLHLEVEDNDFDEDQFAQALAERFTGESARREK